MVKCVDSLKMHALGLNQAEQDRETGSGLQVEALGHGGRVGMQWGLRAALEARMQRGNEVKQSRGPSEASGDKIRWGTVAFL